MKVDAEVTIKFVIPDICDSEDIVAMEDFESTVFDLIGQEGMYDLFEDSTEYQVVNVSRVRKNP